MHSVTDQLPTRRQLNVRPNTRRLRPQKEEDFMAGDMRVNEHPFLATLHVAFVREHNRVAKLLREYLPRRHRTVSFGRTEELLLLLLLLLVVVLLLLLLLQRKRGLLFVTVSFTQSSANVMPTF